MFTGCAQGVSSAPFPSGAPQTWTATSTNNMSHITAEELLDARATELRALRAHLGCCARCTLRFAGIRDPSVYMQAEAALDEATLPAAGAPPPADDAAAVCPICLGCLAHCMRHDAIANFAESVRATDFAMTSFSISISIPVNLLVRERAAWLHLGRVRADTDGLDASPLTRRLNFESITELKETIRWVIAEPLARALGVPVDPNAKLLVYVLFSSPCTAGEHHPLINALLPPESAHLKRKRTEQGQPQEVDSIRAVQRALTVGSRGDELLRASAALCPPRAPAAPCMMGVGIEREPIALTGRYRKYSRSLPQSPWLVEGQLKCAGSVAEFISQHAVPLYAASDAKFHSAGREDVDVRMLGRGRPFLLELLAPKRPEHTAAEIELLQQRINACGLIEISGLREGSLHAVSTLMKEGEEAHRKEYRAVLVLSRPVTDADLARLNGTSELVVDQLTPMRVMHRRTLMVRQRTIHALSATRLGGRFLQLDLVTQAGTYVKEFCHGDFGRTVPNVGSLLGCSTDIMQLDVLDLQDEH